jgi:hypothetical protein
MGTSEPIDAALLSERGSRAAVAGLVFSALFVVGAILLWRGPTVGSSDAEIVRYYTTNARRGTIIAGVYIIPFAGIAFIWFMGALRARTARASGGEHPMFWTVQLISGTVFVTMVFGAGASEVAIAWAVQSTGVEVFDPTSARGLLAFSDALKAIFAIRAMAVFIAIGATRGLRAGLFPRWFVIVSYVMSLALLLVASSVRPVVLVVPLWVTAVSLVILSRRRNLADLTHA